MRTALSSLLAIALVLGVCAGAGAEAPPRLAVREFSVKGNVTLPEAGTALAEWLSSALAKTERYQVLERVLLDKILEEQSISTSGMVDESTTAKIGSFAGAQLLATGSLVEWNGAYTLSARILDLASAKVLKTAVFSTHDSQELASRMPDVASVLVGTLPPESLARSSGVAAKVGLFSGAVKGGDGASVVRATEKDGALRLVIDRGLDDKVAMGAAFAILVPIYGESEVSGTRVRLGMKKVGDLILSYVEPSYGAGDLYTEPFARVDSKSLVAEGVAIPESPVKIWIGGGVYDMGLGYTIETLKAKSIIGFDESFVVGMPESFGSAITGFGLGMAFYGESALLGSPLSSTRLGTGLAAMGNYMFEWGGVSSIEAGLSPFLELLIAQSYRLRGGAFCGYRFPLNQQGMAVPNSIVVEPYFALEIGLMSGGVSK